MIIDILGFLFSVYVIGALFYALFTKAIQATYKAEGLSLDNTPQPSHAYKWPLVLYKAFNRG